MLANVQTGKTPLKKLAKAARTRNHNPTTIRIRPPHRLTAGALARMVAAMRAFADAMTTASVNIRPTMASAAMAKATIAAEKPPTLSDSAARPARIGPVQPKPAST